MTDIVLNACQFGGPLGQSLLQVCQNSKFPYDSLLSLPSVREDIAHEARHMGSNDGRYNNKSSHVWAAFLYGLYKMIDNQKKDK
jgi:hypothetical protein